jgi:hypothetical protein
VTNHDILICWAALSNCRATCVERGLGKRTARRRPRSTLLATYFENGAPTSVAGATLRKRRERALTRLRAAFRRIYAID